MANKKHDAVTIYEPIIPAITTNMDSDLKIVNITEIGKEPDERMNKPYLSWHGESTTNGKSLGLKSILSLSR